MDLTKDAVEYHGQLHRRHQSASRPPEPTDEHRHRTATRRDAAPAPSNVTQARVLLSEWTKLRSLRSTVFSLLAAVVFIVGLSVLVPSVTVAHWPPRDPGEPAAFDPTDAQPRRHLPGPAGHRRARRPAHHRRVRHRDDPGHLRGRAGAAARPVGQGDRLRRRRRWRSPCPPCSSPSSSASRSSRASTSQTHLGDPGVLRAVIGAALYLTVDRRAGSRPRRPAAQHGGRDLHAVRRAVRPPDHRALPAVLAGPTRSTSTCRAPSEQAITHVHPDPGALAPVGRLRPLLRLRRRRARRRGRPAAPPRRLSLASRRPG